MITGDDLLSVTKSVTKEWAAQRKAEERGERSRAARGNAFACRRVFLTEVAADILPVAYLHGSGNGRFTISKRQFYYASREMFRERTGSDIEWSYFADTLLVQYMNRNPQVTAGWKVTADARGNLSIPNATHEVRIPCGTIAIDDHLRKVRIPVNGLDLDLQVPIEWPSLAAGQRYQAVLYIEKEGFEPMLEEAAIAERFDLAILSCKGQSVVAARRFIDHVCRVDGGVPLFVVHDFDKAGFEICQRLTTVSEWAEQNDRVTYRFQNEINVTDFGLRLEDVEAYNLTEEQCGFRGGFADDSHCTEAEREFLRSGRRVELNAFTAPQFLEWLEGKLTTHLPQRLIPPDDVLEEAYRRALAVAEINAVVEEASAEAIANAEAADLPLTLRAELRQEMRNGNTPWDQALYAIAKGVLSRDGAE